MALVIDIQPLGTSNQLAQPTILSTIAVHALFASEESRKSVRFACSLERLVRNRLHRFPKGT